MNNKTQGLGNECEGLLNKEWLAIVFDLDGLLVDSMPFYHEAWSYGLGRLGVPISREEVYMREGEKMELTAEEVFEKHEGTKPPKEVVEAIVKEVRLRYSQIVRIRYSPGAIALLEGLKGKGLKLALVTGSRSLAQTFRDDPRFLDFFDAIVTGDDTKRGKPMPDPYEAAIRKLSLPIDRTCAVENAPLGIKSAVEAGLFCIAVKGHSPLSDAIFQQAGAGCICEDLLMLRNLLLGS